MSGNVILFPASRLGLADRLERRAKQLIAREMVDAYDEGGDAAAEEYLHQLTWALAALSGKVIGAAATEEAFRYAGQHGCDRDEVAP